LARSPPSSTAGTRGAFARVIRVLGAQDLNKINLPSADVPGTRAEIEDVIGFDASRAVAVSAKECVGIKALLKEIVHAVGPPGGDHLATARYDNDRGVIMLVRVVEA